MNCLSERNNNVEASLLSVLCIKRLQECMWFIITGRQGDVSCKQQHREGAEEAPAAAAAEAATNWLIKNIIPRVIVLIKKKSYSSSRYCCSLWMAARN